MIFVTHFASPGLPLDAPAHSRWPGFGATALSLNWNWTAVQLKWHGVFVCWCAWLAVMFMLADVPRRQVRPWNQHWRLRHRAAAAWRARERDWSRVAAKRSHWKNKRIALETEGASGRNHDTENWGASSHFSSDVRPFPLRPPSFAALSGTKGPRERWKYSWNFQRFQRQNWGTSDPPFVLLFPIAPSLLSCPLQFSFCCRSIVRTSGQHWKRGGESWVEKMGIACPFPSFLHFPYFPFLSDA